MRRLVKLSHSLAAVLALTTIAPRPVTAETAADPSDPDRANTKISLVEVEPVLVYQLRRYPKFYGDPNTAEGSLLERTQLLGGLGGGRDTLVEHGLFVDAGVTQFLHGNASGGQDAGETRYEGSADLWVTFDTGKAGLWSGGAFFLHGEGSWQAQRSLNPLVGSLLPASFDATTPAPGDSKALVLPELYLVQALPGNLLFLAGKANFAGVADNNVFANNERYQFSHTGLINNPILGAFIPYTPLGAGFIWAPSEEHTVALIGTQSNGSATRTGFSDFDGDYTVGGQYQFSAKVAGLPGNYRVIAGYQNKDLDSFDVDPRHLFAELVGLAPPVEQDGNYGLMLNFDQYLWIDGGSLEAYERRLDASDYPGVGRHQQPPDGIGIFGRAGWAPEDRNVIDQFYSFGIGGWGMLIPGRDDDNWGFGWSGTHISSDLRDDLDLLSIDVDAIEHAWEVFYNVQVTPATHLTLNAQVIDSALKSVDTAFTWGARLQLDF